jgi:hypothetical protein
MGLWEYLGVSSGIEISFSIPLPLPFTSFESSRALERPSFTAGLRVSVVPSTSNVLLSATCSVLARRVSVVEF